MKVGIIAAGIGERLAKGGVQTPKPLIPLHGEPMIARLIRFAGRLKAELVACIVNDIYPSVAEYLRSRTWPLPLRVIVKTTPNSMESLLALAPLLKDGPFLQLTVDAVFPFSLLEKMVDAGKAVASTGGSVLALTTNTDDERPLWAKIDAKQRIIAIGEPAAGSTRYVTAGVYWFHPSIFELAETAHSRNLSALRQFLALLLESGHPLYGLPVSETIDVDYPEDIAKAEDYLLKIGERS